MKNISKFLLVVGIIGIPFAIWWLRDIAPSEEEQFTMAIKAYELMDFEGIITDKLIDKNDHNYQKLILKKDSVTDAVVLNIETSGIYDFVQIGDSVKKVRKSFFVKVVRDDLDTILRMSFTKIQ